jgi:hypothetical protein
MERREINELELLSKAVIAGESGLDVSLDEFDYIVGQGGRIHSSNEPGPDNSYIHRINYLGYTFKMMTNEPREI